MIMKFDELTFDAMKVINQNKLRLKNYMIKSHVTIYNSNMTKPFQHYVGPSIGDEDFCINEEISVDLSSEDKLSDAPSEHSAIPSSY